MPQRNSKERAELLADRAEAQRSRVAGFTPIAGRRRLSTRGQPHDFDRHPTKRRALRVDKPLTRKNLTVEFLQMGIAL